MLRVLILFRNVYSTVLPRKYIRGADEVLLKAQEQPAIMWFFQRRDGVDDSARSQSRVAVLLLFSYEIQTQDQ